MICHVCEGIFQPKFEPSLETSYPHHLDANSFRASLRRGCQLCWALASELEDVDEVFNTDIVSQTCWTLSSSEDNTSVLLSWLTDGQLQNGRWIALVRHQQLRTYLPRDQPVSRASLQIVNAWMDECATQHPKCAHLYTWKTSGKSYQPTRIVDIGDAQNPLWYLIMREDHNILPNQYVTLSHRWSANQECRLLTTNIESLKNGQPISNLPQTFQDAISVARSMQIRYLWIDCLCIIQDSKVDWDAESLRMRDVYAHSVCSISATGVPDNSSGFLGMLSEPLPLPPRLQPSWAPEVEGGWYAVDVYFWWAEILRMPLLKRGWVFQERFLAPRVLHFGAWQILWECATVDACEIYPAGLPKVAQSESHTHFKRLGVVEAVESLRQNETSWSIDEDAEELRIRGESLNPDTAISKSLSSINYKATHSNAAQDDVDKQILNFWCSIISAYTRTKLTMPNDKLIALAGVAEMTSTLYHRHNRIASTYLAGLFDHHLLLMLEWHACKLGQKFPLTPGKRALDYRAPSWSWASIENRVHYEYTSHVFDQLSSLTRYTTWETFLYEWNAKDLPAEKKLAFPRTQDGWKSLVTNMSAEIVPAAGSSEFGQVSGGYLELQGLIIPSSSVFASMPFIIYQDAPASGGRSHHGTHCLPLRCIKFSSESTTELTEQDSNVYWMTGLILERVTSGESLFQRVGMFCIPSSEKVAALDIEISEDTFEVRIHPGSTESIKII